MRVCVSMFTAFLLLFVSPYVHAYDTDNAIEKFDENFQKEFFVEAKYFLLMRLYQNTDASLSNTMPHAFDVLVGNKPGKTPKSFKRMFLRSLARALKERYGHISIFSEVNVESPFDMKFSGPALRYKFFGGRVKAGIKADFDRGDFSSLKEFPVKPVAFVKIGTNPRVRFSYNLIDEAIKASVKMSAKKERFVFRQGIKMPLDDFKETNFFTDVTYKISPNSHIYVGGALRRNVHDVGDVAGMIIIYGFW